MTSALPLRPTNSSERSSYAGIFIGLSYALSFMVYGVLFPFLPLILHAKGFSDSETSFALSASGLAALVAPLLFAHVADRKVQFRTLMPILLILTGIALSLLCTHVNTISTFLILFAVYFFLVPAIALIDSFTLGYLIHDTTASKKRSFTSYRIWGSIGFMLPAIGLTTWFGNQHISADVIVTLAVVSCFVSAVATRFLPSNSPSAATPQPPSQEAFSAALKPPLRGLFLANCFAGTALAIFHTVQPRFLQEIGFSVAMIGLIINLGVLAEILLMPFSTWIIRVVGLSRLILLAMLTIPLRLFLLSYWPTGAIAIATQILHGPLIIGLIIAVPILLQNVADDSFRYSIQSINTTINLGLTRVTGPIIASLLVSSSHSNEHLTGLTHALGAAGVLGMVAVFCFLDWDESLP